MQLRARTLRRLAEARRRDELKLSWIDRAREAAAAAPSWLGRARVVLLAPPLVALGLLFIPGPFSFDALDDPDAAQSFLSTLWQVEAGTIALSLSVILVAFETIWRRRFRGTVRSFADEVLLLYALSAAFASLLAIGCTLLGWGTNAPGGWAATWATVLSAVALTAVPVVLVLTLRLMNPATLHERRRRQIRAEVRDTVDEEAFERLAYGELKEAVKDSPGIKLTPVLDWEDTSDRLPVTAGRNGVVRDIRIGRLLRIAKKLSVRDPAAITVGARLRAQVSRDTELARITPKASRWQGWLISRAFDVDPNAAPTRLLDLISQVHQEALRALREVEPSTYEDVSELWVELLLELPEAWKRYGNDFDDSVAGSFGRFGFGPVDSVSRNLYIEAREATKSMHDLAAFAYDLPQVVLLRSVDLDASALVKRMLALYVDLYPITAELADLRLRDRLFNLVFNVPKQFAQRVEHDFRDHNAPARKRQRANRNLHLCFRAFMEQMKVIADHDPADAARVGRVNSGWADIFSGWFPEHDKEEEWPGLDDDELARRRELNTRIDAVINQKDALDRLRDAYRFAVAYWALHQLEATHSTDWRGVLETILPWLGNTERLATEAEQVISIDLDDHLFMQWHDSPVQMGWAAPRAFIVFTLLQHAADQIPADIGRRNFLRHGMAAEIETILDGLAADDQLWELLAGRPEDLPARVEALRAAIRTSAAMP